MTVREERRIEQPSSPPDGAGRLEERDNVALVIDDYYPERLLVLFQVISAVSSAAVFHRLSVICYLFLKIGTNRNRNLTGVGMYG